MEELALHILDIAQNSVRAGAKNIGIDIVCDNNDIIIEISDDGCGMDEEMTNNIIDPFSTSRTTRKVGLGIPLFKESCEQSGGSLSINSTKGKGTKITACYEKDNFNRPPLGNIGGTVSALISCNQDISFEFCFCTPKNSYSISTAELKEILNEIPVSNPEIAAFIEKDVNDGIQSVCMEDIL